MARVSGAGAGGTGFGTGFVFHRNLFLTTHAVLPSVAAAEAAEIRLRDGVAPSLFPHRLFITSSILDLTAVALDKLEGDSSAQGQQPRCLKACTKPNLDLGSTVYFLGYTEGKKLTVGEGKVIIATDNLIKLSTDEITWTPGSAGFDTHGNLAFMICDPMKISASPNTKSSTTSSSSSASCNRAGPMQFGIPMPIICDWLNQHWQGSGSLDELSKPRLPFIRLMPSTGQKGDHSSASFTLRRRVFKLTEAENDGLASSSSNMLSMPRHQLEISSSVAATFEEEAQSTDPFAAHHTREQRIPTSEIYESPKLTALSLGKKEGGAQAQLLDINFPPRPPPRRLLSSTDENCLKESKLPSKNPRTEGRTAHEGGPSSACADAEMASVGSGNGMQSEVESSSSPVEYSAAHDGYGSEGETMYSAETAESRNYTSPREAKFNSVGRSQSCASYGKWGDAHTTPAAHRGWTERQRSSVRVGKIMCSQGATSQRSNDYFTPTVSSIMKKRNNSEEPKRPRQTAVHSSPRWMF